jgi:hypothetical protein
MKNYEMTFGYHVLVTVSGPFHELYSIIFFH